MRYYLGIDGGGTKTKFTLGDEYGNIIASIIGPTCHYLQGGFDHVSAVVQQGIESICQKAGIVCDEIGSAFIGAAGYGDVERDKAPIEKAIASAMKRIPHSVGNDGENALAGALCGKDGINIVCGTGSIAVGRNSQSGETLSCGGWHHVLGSDEGSGYWLAVEMIKEFFRQADGRDEKTELYYKVKKHFNLEDDGDIITIIVNEWQLDRTKIASLSLLVGELCEENDRYAISIVDNAAKELCDIISALYKKLHFAEPVDVTYTGGVFKLGDKLLVPMKKYLDAEKMHLVAPVFEPDIGALIIAYRNGGIKLDEKLIANLKYSLLQNGQGVRDYEN